MDRHPVTIEAHINLNNQMNQSELVKKLDDEYKQFENVKPLSSLVSAPATISNKA